MVPDVAACSVLVIRAVVSSVRSSRSSRRFLSDDPECAMWVVCVFLLGCWLPMSLLDSSGVSLCVGGGEVGGGSVVYYGC